MNMLIVYGVTLLAIVSSLSFLGFMIVKYKWRYKEILLFLGGILFAFLVYTNITKQNSIVESINLADNPPVTFNSVLESQDSITPVSDKNIYDYFVSLNVKKSRAKILLAIAKLESNNYKSDIFVNYNNLFGMKNSARRVSTSKYGTNGFAAYNNWQESCIDLIFWMQINCPKGDDSDFLNLCGKVYCSENPEYIKRITAIMSQIKL